MYLLICIALFVTNVSCLLHYNYINFYDMLERVLFHSLYK